MIASALICAAAVVYHEARGEGYKGQVAVASVVLNRVKKNGTDICTEINRAHQFPWTKHIFKKIKGQYHLIAKKIAPTDSWFASLTVASNVLDGTDTIIPKITSFDSKPHPEWKMGKPIKIGKHFFYKDS